MFKTVFAVLALACAFAFGPGCATTGVTSVSTQDFKLQPSTNTGGAVSKLVAGDAFELSVEVDGRMEVMGHRAAINNAGMATLPLVGDIRITNMTVLQARSAIAKAYGAYFVNAPVVMFSRVEDAVDGEWGFVTVTGRVGQPGRVKILSAKGIKLTAVIQQAGGFAASAKKTDIRITRVEQDGRKIQVTVDYSEIGEKGNLDADVDLKDGDIVYVPQRIL